MIYIDDIYPIFSVSDIFNWKYLIYRKVIFFLSGNQKNKVKKTKKTAKLSQIPLNEMKTEIVFFILPAICWQNFIVSWMSDELQNDFCRTCIICKIWLWNTRNRKCTNLNHLVVNVALFRFSAGWDGLTATVHQVKERTDLHKSLLKQITDIIL